MQKNKRIHTVSNLHYRLFRHHQHQDFVNASIKVGSYEIDYQSNTLKTTDKNGNQTYSLDRSKMHIDLDVDAEHFKDKITILLPVTSIGHDELELVCTNLFEFNHPAPPGINRFLSKYSWDIPKKHQMFIDPVQNKESTVHLRHYLDSGVMRFYLK